MVLSVGVGPTVGPLAGDPLEDGWIWRMEVRRTDGAENEEHAPDILYVWRNLDGQCARSGDPAS